VQEGPAPITLSQVGIVTEVAPGIFVIIGPLSGSKLELASKVTTRVRLEASEPTELILRSSEVVVPEGTRMTASFVAFSPHVGTIRIYNEAGTLLAEVPYEVRKQSQFRQSISGSASASLATDFATSVPEGSLSFSFRVEERGRWACVRVFDGRGLQGSGTISGTYSW